MPHSIDNFWSTSVATGTLNNVDPICTFGVLASPTVSMPMFAVVDPQGTPEVLDITAVDGLNLTATRLNPVMHAGSPAVYCAPVAEYQGEILAFIAALQAAVTAAAPPATDPIMTDRPHSAVNYSFRRSQRASSRSYAARRFI